MISGTRLAQIEPTTRCNYTCGFCAGRSMVQGDLSWDVFERFLAAHPLLEHVELQGEGEPLLHPRFFDMVSACRSRGIKVSLITNGSMLGAAVIERFVTYGVDSVHISLESADAAEFQIIRGGKFSKVVNGLREFMKRRRELNAEHPRIGLSVTVLRRTLGGLDRIVALYKELGLDGGIAIQRLQSMACYTGGYNPEMLEQQVPENLWRDYLNSLEHIMQGPGVRTGAPSYYRALFQGFDPGQGQCPWLERGAYLSIDGTVTGCCFMKDPRDAFGNISTSPMPEIESRRRSLAQVLHAGAIPPACSGCGVAEAIARAVKVKLQFTEAE